ncbi:MAG: hypothetical protein K8U57_20220 [Planctomycetes bacterium]|nr:hypothetical protein [Planctomycetota bacterium]
MSAPHDDPGQPWSDDPLSDNDSEPSWAIGENETATPPKVQPPPVVETPAVNPPVAVTTPTEAVEVKVAPPPKAQPKVVVAPAPEVTALPRREPATEPVEEARPGRLLAPLHKSPDEPAPPQEPDPTIAGLAKMALTLSGPKPAAEPDTRPARDEQAADAEAGRDSRSLIAVIAVCVSVVGVATALLLSGSQDKPSENTSDRKTISTVLPVAPTKKTGGDTPVAVVPVPTPPKENPPPVIPPKQVDPPMPIPSQPIPAGTVAIEAPPPRLKPNSGGGDSDKPFVPKRPRVPIENVELDPDKLGQDIKNPK